MPQFFKQNLLAAEPLLPKPEELLPEHATPPAPDSRVPTPDYYEDDIIQDLLVWTAPARPYRKKDRSFYTVAIILVILISLVATLWFNAPMLGAALAALLFVVFVLDYIPPEEIEYKISTQGVTIGEHFYHWYDLESFWLGDKDQNQLLYIRTHYRFPSLLIIVLGPVAEPQIKQTIAHFLPFQEIAPKSLLDDWSKSLQKHFPLETPRH